MIYPIRKSRNGRMVNLRSILEAKKAELNDEKVAKGKKVVEEDEDEDAPKAKKSKKCVGAQCEAEKTTKKVEKKINKHDSNECSNYCNKYKASEYGNVYESIMRQVGRALREELGL